MDRGQASCATSPLRLIKRPHQLTYLQRNDAVDLTCREKRRNTKIGMLHLFQKSAIIVGMEWISSHQHSIKRDPQDPYIYLITLVHAARGELGWNVLRVPILENVRSPCSFPSPPRSPAYPSKVWYWILPWIHSRSWLILLAESNKSSISEGMLPLFSCRNRKAAWTILVNLRLAFVSGVGEEEDDDQRRSVFGWIGQAGGGWKECVDEDEEENEESEDVLHEGGGDALGPVGGEASLLSSSVCGIVAVGAGGGVLVIEYLRSSSWCW